MQINFWAVLVSAVVSMVVGTIWYGPLFGKVYLRETGMDALSEEEKAKGKKMMWRSYLGQFIASLVMFYVLAWLIGSLNQMTVTGGLSAAFWAWIGFIVPVKLSDALWGGKMSLFWLSIGGSLVTILAAGAIIGGWM